MGHIDQSKSIIRRRQYLSLSRGLRRPLSWRRARKFHALIRIAHRDLVLLIGAAVVLVAVFAGLTPDPSSRTQLAQVYGRIPTAAGKALFKTQSQNFTREVDPILVDLDSQIITCSPDVGNLMADSPVAGGSCFAGPTKLSTTAGMYLGGQCCGAKTDTRDYTEELEKMQKYRGFPDMPMNPYKTPISLAKKWIDYDKATTLTPAERNVFDEAMSLSKEKPCCCKCWHYFVNQGIGKMMIKDHHYTAQKVAEYWDTATIC